MASHEPHVPQATWTRRKRTWIVVAFAAIMVAVAGLLVTSTQPEVEGTATQAVPPAPDDGREPFVEFTLTGADGKPITKASLAGKKSIIWFTKSTCPDSDGMAQTAALDDELGGAAFNVVVVLVDLQEPAPWLTEWRDGFGRPDWLVAPDSRGELTAKVSESSPENKVLLDERGKVITTWTGLVDPGYLELLREQVATT